MRYAIFLACLFATVPAFGDGWEIDYVADSVFDNFSSVLDSNGYAHVLFTWSGTFNEIYYANNTSGNWEYEHLRMWSNYGMSLGHLVVDAEDHLYAACFWYDYIPEYVSWLTYVELTDPWGTLAVSNLTAIGVDSYGDLHIAGGYGDDSYGPLAYGKWNGSTWDITVVDPAVDIFGWGDTYIALDSSDRPHICYESNTDHDLKYAYWDDSAWDISVVDVDCGNYPGGSNGPISMVLDSNGYPHILYSDSTGDFLKYAHWNGSAWEIETINPYNSWGEDIFVDSNNCPHVTYCDDNGIKYAYRDASGWNFYVVTEDMGGVGTINLDSNGDPHILYSEGFSLYYANYYSYPDPFNLFSPSNGSTIPEPITLDWEDSQDSDPITYDVWYSLDETFSTYEEIPDLTDSTYTFPDGVLTQGETYYWKVRAWDGAEETWSGPDDYWSFTVEVEQGIDDEETIPTTFALHPATPNPSDGSASIGFALPRECAVDLAVYDVKGRRIKTLASGHHTPGEHTASVEGLSSGVYLYTLEAGDFAETRKMVVR